MDAGTMPFCQAAPVAASDSLEKSPLWSPCRHQHKHPFADCKSSCCCAACLIADAAFPPAGISTKTNLVIAPVADTSEHRLWLRDFPSANWDMVAIYYGSNATTFACEECIHVEANRGPKWQVVYQFTQGEAFKKLYSKQYQQVGRTHGGTLWSLVVQQQEEARVVHLVTLPSPALGAA